MIPSLGKSASKQLGSFGSGSIRTSQASDARANRAEQKRRQMRVIGRLQIRPRAGGRRGSARPIEGTREAGAGTGGVNASVDACGGRCVRRPWHGVARVHRDALRVHHVTRFPFTALTRLALGSVMRLAFSSRMRIGAQQHGAVRVHHPGAVRAHGAACGRRGNLPLSAVRVAGRCRRRFRRYGIIAFGTRNGLSDQLFDRSDRFVVERGNDSEGGARAAGTAGAADAVDVIVGMIGTSKLKTWLTSGISRPRAATSEATSTGSSPSRKLAARRTGTLVHVAMQGADAEAVFLQRLVDDGDFALANVATSAACSRP